MKLKLTGITSCLGRQALIAQKHAPTILFGAGIAGFVGTVVAAVRATPKVEEILKETEERIEKAKTLQHELYSELDRKKDMTTVYVQSAIKIAKAYGPTIIIGALSIAALGGSHRILNRRNASLGAAYMAVQEAFEKYRNRVIEEHGEDADLKFRHGSVTSTFAEDTDTGVITKDVQHYAGASMYGRIFDEFNPNFSRNPDSNYEFLANVQNYLNDRLLRRGHIFLNEVYQALGFEDTPEGQIVGWLLKNDETKSDGKIDLGFEKAGDFVFGPNKSVLLDFNVDGPIYHLLGKN